MARECREVNGKHNYGHDGNLRLAKHMERETEVEPTPTQVWKRGHWDPSQSEQCSQVTTEQLAKYGEEARRIPDEDFDWEHEPIDSQATYASGDGKATERLPYSTQLSTRERRDLQEAAPRMHLQWHVESSCLIERHRGAGPPTKF